MKPVLFSNSASQLFTPSSGRITLHGALGVKTLDSYKGLLIEAGFIARPLRIEHEGTHYHVTSRGNERKRSLETRQTGRSFWS
jgi:hypothetical protein